MTGPVCTYCEKPVKQGQQVIVSCGGICYMHVGCKRQDDMFLERCERTRRERKGSGQHPDAEKALKELES